MSLADSFPPLPLHSQSAELTSPLHLLTLYRLFVIAGAAYNSLNLIHITLYYRPVWV